MVSLFRTVRVAVGFAPTVESVRVYVHVVSFATSPAVNETEVEPLPLVSRSAIGTSSVLGVGVKAGHPGLATGYAAPVFRLARFATVMTTVAVLPSSTTAGENEKLFGGRRVKLLVLLCKPAVMPIVQVVSLDIAPAVAVTSWSSLPV